MAAGSLTARKSYERGLKIEARHKRALLLLKIKSISWLKRQKL